MPRPRRVLIVDDHATFRLGLGALLETVPGVAVVGEADSGHAAVTAAGALRPDVVVMDLHMPDLDGLTATERITRAHPEVAVLVLTMDDAAETVFAAVRAGAGGYLLKTAGQDEIVRAIQAVADGEMIFGNPVATQVRALFAAAPAPAGDLGGLTGREREVLVMIVRGEGNAAIARRLVVSPKTVRNHITHIFRKLEVADRGEAIRRGRAAGLR
ncbi:response regulator [Actinokineospora diospyrosa]|uniref:Two component transcriptional regulator, LuxR family n=1 Tax=Actinokineospora diospyrosa TaxID=103728 RepID=A0ABT1IFS6_9PSEU|nr:response regulator transcription factor [Actinokineospora diospyrosa]MCP2271497.1 two component transcriptional regulator, LuxR family [Actinokineospora diospyrosa]